MRKRRSKMIGAKKKAFDTEPRMIVLKEPILMLGMQVETGMKSVFGDVSRLGKRWQAFKKTGMVPNRKEPWAFVAVSKDHDQLNGRWNYLMGDVVTRVDAVPAGLAFFAIPSGRYAVFTLWPSNRFAWGLTIAMAKRYIYAEWFPNSGFKANSAISDFELHDERSTLKRGPSIDLYVAVKET
jgi:predicted transcriptional regulator YdeE